MDSSLLLSNVISLSQVQFIDPVLWLYLSTSGHPCTLHVSITSRPAASLTCSLSSRKFIIFSFWLMFINFLPHIKKCSTLQCRLYDNKTTNLKFYIFLSLLNGEQSILLLIGLVKMKFDWMWGTTIATKRLGRFFNETLKFGSKSRSISLMGQTT